jgi:hypothetical protein
MSQVRWSPLSHETAQKFFERAMRDLIEDFEYDYSESPGSGLFRTYFERAAQLGRNLASDLLVEHDWIALGIFPPRTP